MLYSEAEDKLVKMGYTTMYQGDELHVRNPDILTFEDVYVTKDGTNIYTMTPAGIPNDLLRVLSELIDTPPDERIQQQLYYVKLSGVEEDNAYLNIYNCSGDIYFLDKRDSPTHKVKFTEKEIKDINVNYMFFAVKCEDN